MNVTKDELVKIINLAADAVDASRAGPIVLHENEDGSKTINAWGVYTYYYVLQALLPKEMHMTGSMETPKEPW